MSLIVSQKPVKFLKENSQFVSEPSPGHYIVDYNLYKLHILNLEELSLDQGIWDIPYQNYRQQ